MDRILDFWNEIYDKSIELYHAYSSDYTFDNIKNLLNKYNNEELSFYFNEERNELYIFYKDYKHNKRNIATIYCLRHIDRGGEGEWFIPKILKCNKGIYLKKEKIGRCIRDFSLTYNNLTIINESSLVKYDEDGNSIWETNLNRNTTQTLRLNYTHQYPDESWELGLTVVEDLYALYYYDKNGDFYRKCNTVLEVVE